MMAGSGSNPSSSTPKPPPTGTAHGCVQSRGANPVSNPAPAPGAPSRNQSPAAGGRTQSPAAAGRTQSPAAPSRTQSPAAGGRGQPSATADRAALQISNPTEDEKNAVALYPERWQKHPFGMHTVRPERFPYLYYQAESLT